VKVAPLLAPLALALALPLSGCSSIAQQGPSDTLRAYSRALEEGRADDAYRLLSDEAKRTMSLDAFRRAVKESPDDAREIARALARPATDPTVTARVVTANGDELLLVYESGRWRIDASAVDLYAQATPRQAIMGFLRAFERKRYDVILRFVPDADREGVDDDGAASGPKPRAGNAGADDASKPGADGKPGEAKPAGNNPLTAERLKEWLEGPYKEQITRIVQGIKTALPTAQIEETGDSAAMSYGAGGTVALVREHGVWKIKEL
jgi:hypothetical protein